MAIRNFERELESEILQKLANSAELRRKVKEFAEDVRDYARRTAAMDIAQYAATGKGGYATGDFVASIKVERNRDVKGRFVGGYSAWRVVSRDEKAHFLEYGTGPDNPESRSPWGPNTPTPEYATFAKTAFHYRGTPDGDL